MEKLIKKGTNARALQSSVNKMRFSTVYQDCQQRLITGFTT